MLGENENVKTSEKKRIQWYLWPLVPIVFCATLVVMIPLGILALFSIPYFTIYPDRHAHLYDFEAMPRQKRRLTQWREMYSNLSFRQRLTRAWKKHHRSKKRHRPRTYNKLGRLRLIAPIPVKIGQDREII